MIFGKNITKSFGTQMLFENADFQANSRERIGIVGRNGYGKSTLFQLILGTAVLDDGEIAYPDRYHIGTLDQHLSFTKPTILEEVAQVLPPSQKHDHWKAEKILSGLGFSSEAFSQSAATFSGGYQMRIKLSQLLISEPDCLLLDEPTNHLDIVSIRWLESFLRQWSGEVLCISHDQAFLEHISTHTIAIHRRKFKKIKGPPAKCYEQISQEEDIYNKSLHNEGKKRAKQEKFIREFRAGARSAGLVQSRIKMLEKKGPLTTLAPIPQIKFCFPELDFTGAKVLDAEQLSFGYNPGEDLLKKLSLEVFPGEKIGIIGANGKGKTTLLNILSDTLPPQAGTIKWYNNLDWGSFGQSNQERLDPKKSILEELMDGTDRNEQKVRALAGSLLFSGDLVHKNIEILSGGEKARVNLGKILLKPTNLLFLDEPTNHLDYESVQALTEALMRYTGAIVFVSHDEYFLKKIAQKLVIFDGASVFVFRGGYEDFLNAKGFSVEQLERLPLESVRRKKAPAPRNDIKALQRLLRPLQRKLAQREQEISGIEKAQKENMEAFSVAHIQGNRIKLDMLGGAYQDLQRSLEKKMTDWASLGQEIEKIEGEIEKSPNPL